MSAVTTVSLSSPPSSPAAGPLPAPQAARLRRPSWRDRRLLVGLLLVLLAVGLGARVVAQADRTVPVFAARGTLPVGSALTVDTLTVVRVRLAGAEQRYLSAERPLPSGQVLTRAVGAGELVPAAALAPAVALDRRPLGIPVDGVLPAGLAPGGLVDVWASARDRKAGGSAFAKPERLVASAPVYQVTAPTSGLAVSRTTTVHVLLADADLARVLAALANGSRTAVVPVPGSAPGTGS